MFDKLKKLISKRSTPDNIEVLDLKDGLLSFKSGSQMSLGRRSVGVKSSSGQVMVEVEVQSHDETSGIYRAVVLSKDDALNAIYVGVRGQVRLDKTLKATTPQLPGITAQTEDISVGGARLVTPEPLEKGADIELNIELDGAILPPLRLTAKVRWIAKKPDGTCHSGLQFISRTPLQVATLEYFINNRLVIERRLHDQLLDPETLLPMD